MKPLTIEMLKDIKLPVKVKVIGPKGDRLILNSIHLLTKYYTYDSTSYGMINSFPTTNYYLDRFALYDENDKIKDALKIINKGRKYSNWLLKNHSDKIEIKGNRYKLKE